MSTTKATKGPTKQKKKANVNSISDLDSKGDGGSSLKNNGPFDVDAPPPVRSITL